MIKTFSTAYQLGEWLLTMKSSNQSIQFFKIDIENKSIIYMNLN